MNIPLNIDWQQILLHMLNFTILALGLFLVLYNPVKKFMQKRKEYYEEIEKKAAEAEENARNIENEYKQLLENAEKEISIRAAEESKRIAAEAEDRIKRAEEQAAKIIADARVWAQHERTRMLEEVQGEIADMVVSSTEQLLSKDKTPETNKAIFDQFLSISGEDNNKK